MNDQEIQKLRSGGLVKVMGNGEEGVPVTLQFKGSVPPLARPERKKWLEQHFNDWERKIADLPVQITSESISISGQSVDGVAGVRNFEQICDQARKDSISIEIIAKHQVAG